uniref:Uncharacterized protein n=1 Tax=Heterorhabditis bacteriophora TaxID=37862 RepID=A0A1I7WEL9_HETBA
MDAQKASNQINEIPYVLKILFIYT